MKTVDIVCPDCGKLLLKVTPDSEATLVCYCKRCKLEKIIKKNRAKEPVNK